MFKRLIDSFRSSAHRTRRRQSRPPVLNLESLEDRRMLATFAVTSNIDGPVAAAGDLPGSLRQAIFDANVNPGDDTIEFDSAVFTGGDASLIRLTQGELLITDAVTIDGSTGTNVTITGDANGDDVTDDLNITDVDASFGGTAGAADDLLDDNSRVLNFSLPVPMDGFSFDDLTGNLTVNGLTVTGGHTTGSNSAGSGGGIQARGFSTLTINNSIISGNSTSGFGANGGGIYLSGTETQLNHSFVSGNRTMNGAGYAPLFGYGRGTASGGGIFSSTLVTTLNDTVVHENRSTADGGGILQGAGTLTLNRSTVNGNTAVGRGADGGGIRVGSNTLRLSNSTVSGNSALGSGSRGGGIGDTRSELIFTNSTVSGNSSGGDGGGIGTLAGSVSLVSSTVSGNTAGSDGGGIGSIVNGGITVESSIVADNTASFGNPNLDIRDDNTFTINHSLIGVADGLSIVGNVGNLAGTVANPLDPMLGPLADNGGPTQTHALLPGSPAIDAGRSPQAIDQSGRPLVKDQRGFSRLVDGDNDGTATADIGAYELGGTSALLFPVVTSIARNNEGGVLTRPDLLSTFSVTFDVDVSVSADDLVIRNDTLGGAVVDSSAVTFEYDAEGSTATWDFSSLTLDPAFYSFELSDDIVSADGSLSLDGDTDGNPGGAFVESVYVALPGDANLDGQVDVLNDAFALVGNLGRTGGATWTQGDFNGDGDVDVLNDAFILVAHLGQSVVPPAPALATSAAGQTSQMALVNPMLNRSVVIVDARENLLDKQESELRATNSVSSGSELSLAGSQDIDAAFESSHLFDENLF